MERSLYPTLPILLVDDEEQFIRTAAMTLMSEGISNTVLCSDSREVLKIIADKKFGMILLDLNMPHISGIDLLPLLAKDYPDITIIIITAQNDVKIAVDCMKKGAFDYSVKPIRKEELITTIRKAFVIS